MPGGRGASYGMDRRVGGGLRNPPETAIARCRFPVGCAKPPPTLRRWFENSKKNRQRTYTIGRRPEQARFAQPYSASPWKIEIEKRRGRNVNRPVTRIPDKKMWGRKIRGGLRPESLKGRNRSAQGGGFAQPWERGHIKIGFRPVRAGRRALTGRQTFWGLRSPRAAQSLRPGLICSALSGRRGRDIDCATKTQKNVRP